MRSNRIQSPLKSHERVMKRSFDLIVTTITIPFWLPPALLIAILVKIESPGPILFKQQRVGYSNIEFGIYKFRSMMVEHTDDHASTLTKQNDFRVTRVGKIIRSFSLDELPNLINVYQGTMSLVGPRPHALGALAGKRPYPEAVANYEKRHNVLPGLTGLAQIRGYRGPTDTIDDLKNRVDADIEYVRNWSLLLDLKIILLTFISLAGRNAF